MTEFLIKLAPAINGIDGGCSSCITAFLAKSYLIEKYDLDEVMKHIKYAKKKSVEEYIEDLKEQ